MLQIGGSELAAEVRAAKAVAFAEEIHRALDRLGPAAPRLQHGDPEACVRLPRSLRFGPLDLAPESPPRRKKELLNRPLYCLVGLETPELTTDSRYAP
jgi:hypothetical protein